MIVLLTLMVSIPVATAAICRLAPMKAGTHRLEWLAVYLLMLLGALVSALDAIILGVGSWPQIMLLSACGLYLWHSRHTWRPRPPAWMERA